VHFAPTPAQDSQDALAALQAYTWPGNVRQLRNVVDWLLIMAPGETSAEQPGTPEPAAPSGADTESGNLRLDAILFGETQGRIVISVAAINAAHAAAQRTQHGGSQGAHGRAA